jgi:hypothetical protein
VPSGMQGRFTPEQLLSWPQRVWAAGSATESSDDEDYVVLPFDSFAACRWLDTSPDDAEVSWTTRRCCSFNTIALCIHVRPANHMPADARAGFAQHTCMFITAKCM